MLRFATFASLALAAALPASEALALDYPTRLVHVIAPYGPGGPSDVFSRIVAQKLSEALKQSFVVENRPGASTMIGTDAVAKAPPDGYTLLIISQTHATNETLVANKPFQLLRDFVPVAPIYSGDLMLVVHKSVPVKTLKEFIALAKAKPGTLNYASSGTGSQYHLAGELFKTMTGTDIVHVPYKGSTGARNDILGGQVQMMFDTIPTMNPTVEAGLVRALGTSGETRSFGGRRARLRRVGMGRDRRAGRNAQTDRRPPEHRDQQDPQFAGDQGRLGEAGRRPDVDDFRRIRHLHQGRNREMGEGRPGRRREDQLIRAGRSCSGVARMSEARYPGHLTACDPASRFAHAGYCSELIFISPARVPSANRPPGSGARPDHNRARAPRPTLVWARPDRRDVGR
jgi:tripartite-type tricarboxylate transporter receptor subunit TctC